MAASQIEQWLEEAINHWTRESEFAPTPEIKEARLRRAKWYSDKLAEHRADVSE